jgi:formylglycine-generating enzyme required for sulfatase activity
LARVNRPSWRAQALHYGNTLSSLQANVDGNAPYGAVAKSIALGRTTRVGSYDPNPWGLYDMHGNVWQWCGDWYGKFYYKTSPKQDPQGESAGTDRVLRGGGWGNAAQNCRAAARTYETPDTRCGMFGFRAVVRMTPKGS